AGHALHTEFAAKILEETLAWRLISAPVDPATLPMVVQVKGTAPVSRIDAPASRTDPAGRRTAFENASFPAHILVSRQVDGNVGRVIDFLRRVGGGGGVEREIGAIVNRLMARAFWG